MYDVLDGVRVVEMAHWVFVPTAGAVLADWGADVIKVEDTGFADPTRTLIKSTVMTPAMVAGQQVTNRGKRSVALDLSSSEGREQLYELVETADVFITSFMTKVRKKLGIDVDDLRARNPDLIYVRGTGQG